MPQDVYYIKEIRNTKGVFEITVWPEEGQDRPVAPFLPVGSRFEDEKGNTYTITDAMLSQNGYTLYADPFIGRLEDEKRFSYAYVYQANRQ